MCKHASAILLLALTITASHMVSDAKKYKYRWLASSTYLTYRVIHLLPPYLHFYSIPFFSPILSSVPSSIQKDHNSVLKKRGPQLVLKMIATTVLSSLAMASLAFAEQLYVPVPWEISNLDIYNTRHGTGGTCVFPLILRYYFVPSILHVAKYSLEL